MTVRTPLIAVTAVAVICDSMLLPFYPQYFAIRYGVVAPEHVGIYLAFVSAVAMVALPFWARLARRLHPVRLIIPTQAAAALLSVACAFAPSIGAFWALSLGMILFKASYLLIYPYLMSLGDEISQARMIGVVAVVVHIGGIFGAVAGGLVLQVLDYRDIFLIMAAGDLAQMGLCAFLLPRLPSERGSELVNCGKGPLGRPRIARLCLVMVLFYFSAYLIRPFFSVHWQGVTGLGGTALAGAVYAIPGVVAVLVLVQDMTRARSETGVKDPIVRSALIGISGMLLQAAPSDVAIIVGRVLFGWSLFRITVWLDVLLFRSSRRGDYASDFGTIHVFQGLGVLAASYTAGAFVDAFGLTAPFLTGAIGLAATAIVYRSLLAVPRPAGVFGPSHSANHSP